MYVHVRMLSDKLSHQSCQQSGAGCHRKLPVQPSPNTDTHCQACSVDVASCAHSLCVVSLPVIDAWAGSLDVGHPPALTYVLEQHLDEEASLLRVCHPQHRADVTRGNVVPAVCEPVSHVQHLGKRGGNRGNTDGTRRSGRTPSQQSHCGNTRT